MSEQDTLNQNETDLKQAVTELRKVSEFVEKQSEIDAETQAKMDRIEKSVGEASEKINEAAVAELGRKALEEQHIKRLDDIEAAVANVGTGGKKDTPSDAMKAFADYLRKGGVMDQEHVEAIGNGLIEKNVLTHDPILIDLAKKDLVVGVNPDGGYFITPERSTRILTRVFETSPVRALATTETTTSSSMEFVLDDDEFGSGWVGEIDARPDTTTAAIGLIVIPAHELYASPKASQKMLDDAGFDIEGWITRKVGDKFSRDENTAFVTGDGAAKPKGFLDYAASSDEDVYERGTIGQNETAASTTLAADDLKDVQGNLKEFYQGNATWAMKRSTWAVVTKLQDSQGLYLFDTRENLRTGQPLELLGRPVVLMNDMPVIAASSLSVAYADFREAYTIVDRIGIRVLRDPYTSKPNVIFYTTKRTGGAVTNYDAIKLIKIKA